jgi:serine/threonine-protein kinase
LPRVFGRYKLFDFIGRGGMAEIYLARAETALGAARLCVLKQIVAEFAAHPQFAEMLTHEAKLAARLGHANIVQVFDLGREEGQLFIAMEYVEGLDLNALLRRCSQTKTPLPAEFALRIMCDVLTGLDYAHRAKDETSKPLGIVHRDVSPSNVLISLEGEVKLCDFGIAHANDVVERETPHVDEAIKGKAGYMSPEHARGEALDPRADVFAAGIVLWELLSGKRLYRADAGRPPLLEQARGAEIPPMPARGLPEEARLAAIVSRALAPKKDDRYPSAGAMLRDLEEYVVAAKLGSSPLKLGEWIVDRFGVATIQQRRARERTVSDRPPPPEETTGTRMSPSAPVSATVASAPPAAQMPDIPKALPLPKTEPMESTDKAPVAVVAGTVDLGPPSSATLAKVSEHPPASGPSSDPAPGPDRAPPASGKAFAWVILAVAAAIVAWLAMGR